MPKLKALIAAKKAALKSAKGAAKAALQNEIASLQFALASLNSAPSAAYKKTTKTETKEEKTDDEEDDEKAEDAEHDEPDGDEKEESESDAEDAEGDDSDEDAKMADEDEEDEEPKKDARKGQSAALVAKAAAHDRLAAEVAQLRAESVKREKAELIESALAGRRITKAHAKMLRGEKLSFVKGFLKMHTKALYHAEGEELLPDGTELDKSIATGRMSDRMMQMFQQASAASGIPVEKLIANYKLNPDPVNGIARKGS